MVLNLLYNEVTEVNAKTHDGVFIFVTNKTAFDLAFEKYYDEIAKILIVRRILM